jgi:hypothetical protein
MVEYFVRIDLVQLDSFNDFCERNNISHRLISVDGWQNELPSYVYAAGMTYQDAMALKLLMQIDIMETQNG